MLGTDVKLGPDRNHDPGVQIVVELLDHTPWIGEPAGVKDMASPLILVPVEPVQYNIIEGDLTLAELLDHREKFFLAGVALAALPEAEGPFGHERSLASERAIAADDLIEILAMDEVIVNLVTDLGPE